MFFYHKSPLFARTWLPDLDAYQAPNLSIASSRKYKLLGSLAYHKKRLYTHKIRTKYTQFRLKINNADFFLIAILFPYGQTRAVSHVDKMMQLEETQKAQSYLHEKKAAQEKQEVKNPLSDHAGQTQFMLSIQRSGV